MDVTRERRQFVYSMDAIFSLDLAKRFIAGKIRNQRRLIRRYNNRRPNQPLASAVQKLSRAARQVQSAETVEQLRGVEGHASAVFFGVLARLIAESVASRLDSDIGTHSIRLYRL